MPQSAALLVRYRSRHHQTLSTGYCQLPSSSVDKKKQNSAEQSSVDRPHIREHLRPSSHSCHDTVDRRTIQDSSNMESLQLFEQKLSKCQAVSQPLDHRS